MDIKLFRFLGDRRHWTLTFACRNTSHVSNGGSLAGLFYLLTTGLLLICMGVFVVLFQPYDLIFKWVSFRKPVHWCETANDAKLSFLTETFVHRWRRDFPTMGETTRGLVLKGLSLQYNQPRSILGWPRQEAKYQRDRAVCLQVSQSTSCKCFSNEQFDNRRLMTVINLVTRL